MIRNISLTLTVVACINLSSIAAQKDTLPVYNEKAMEKRCGEFLQTLDIFQIVRDYPKAVKNLLSADSEKQINGLNILRITEDLNAIPWIIPFLDSDNINVKVCAGSAMENLVSSCSLQRRDMSFPDKVVNKSLSKDDVDLRPLAWVILKMLRDESSDLQPYAATMIGCLNLDYFDEELQLLLKSRHPAVVNSAQAALDMLKNAKLNSPKQASENEDYNVYSTVLIQQNHWLKEKDTLLVDQLTTLGLGSRVDMNDEDIMKSKAYLNENFGNRVSDELIDNFFKINSKPIALQNNFNKNLNVILLSEKGCDVNSKPMVIDETQSLSTRYPTAKVSIRMSRIAFDKEKTKALLYYESIGLPAKGGSGELILLHKQDNEWISQNVVLCKLID